MNKHSLLISDLHLSPGEPALCGAFQAYCQNRARQAEALYILGDLSDAWVGDDDDAETATLIRSELKKLVDAGTQVFLMPGNRDFMIGQQLANDCGLSLLDDPSIVNLYGYQVLLTHGDSYCTDDKEYMAFREQIQNPMTRQMLLSKSLDERRAIAAQLRSQSKSANASKAADIMDVNQEAVMQAFAEHEVITMIHGHTHRPDTHQYQVNIKGSDKTATRYVLGDWLTADNSIRGWEIRADEQGFTLEQFSL